MGLIKAIFKKKPPANSTTTPMTGGSIFNDSIKLETTETITLDSMRAAFDAVSNKSSLVNYQYWWVLNFHANYFANLFKLENVEDINLYHAIILTFRMYFYYGNAGIIVNQDQSFIPVYEVESKTKKDGSVDYIKVGYAHDIVSQGVNAYDKMPANIYTIKGEELKNYARLIGGENAFIKWLPFVRLQTEMLTLINNHRFFMNKKLLINVNDPDALKQETDLFFDINNPFIINIDTDNINSNKFESQGFSGHVNANDLLDYYSFVIKVYYELLGRRLNIDFKNERNTAKEVDASQSNFDILTNNEFAYKTMFINDLNKLLHTNIVITNPYELSEEKQQKEEEDDIPRMESK